MSDEGGVTLSQETDHVSPAEVTPELGEEAQDTWRSLSAIEAAGLIKPAQCPASSRGEAEGKPEWRGCIRTSV